MKIKYAFLALLALPLISNCKKDEEPEPEKANISGYVALYDEGVNLLDSAGMTVSVEGVSASATTLASGEYFISGVVLGTYSLKFEKDGYGTYKMFDVVLNKANIIHHIVEIPSLGKVSTSTVTNLSHVVQGDNVRLFISTFPKGSTSLTTYTRVFFKKGSGVTNTSYDGFSDIFDLKTDPSLFTITKSELLAMGFSSGDIIYTKVYGESFYANDYDDPDLGMRVFPNLNETAANEISFVVP